MRARAKVLVVSQYGTGSFFRVAWSIMAPLAHRFDVHYLGIGERRPSRCERGVHVHPNPTPNELVRDLEDLAGRLRPDVVLVVHAIHVVGRVCRTFDGRPSRPSLVAYFPVEGRILRVEAVAPLRILDRAVVYHEHAREELAHRSGLGRLDVVPLGMDHGLFAPLTSPGDHERCRRARARLFPDRPELADAFIVLNGNDAVVRKRLDVTLWGFAEFVRDKPEGVYLCLHRADASRQAWEDLRLLADRLGILDRLLPPSPDGARGTLPDEALNLLYNACEVGVNTSMAEGWGLVGFEHAATGAAQIVPRHSGLDRMWGGAAHLLPTRAHLRFGGDLEMDVVPSSAVSAALQELYADPTALARSSRNAWERAGVQWSWSAVSDRFGGILDEVVS